MRGPFNWLHRILTVRESSQSVAKRFATPRLAFEILENRIVPTAGFDAAPDTYDVVHDHSLIATADGSNGTFGVLHNDAGLITVTEVNGSDSDVGQEIELPSGALLALNADGSFLCQPVAATAYEDSFTYQAECGNEFGVATVTINVTNETPVAADDRYHADGAMTIVVESGRGVLANDADADPDEVLTSELVTGPYSGVLNLNADGSFDYAPNENFSGYEAFVYNLIDGTGAVSQATIHFTSSGVAKPDGYSFHRSSNFVVDAEDGVLRNDEGFDENATLSVSIEPDFGEVTLNDDGSFIYTPDDGDEFVGADEFTYVIDGGTAPYNTTTVFLTLDNDAPVGNADEFHVEPGTELEVSGEQLCGNDYDPDGDEMEAEVVEGEGPSHGTLDYFNADGGFKYTPNLGFSGTDQFQYVRTDGVGTSDPVTVTLFVQAGPAVDIANTRGNDFVVSARDPNNIADIPGGIKNLWVRISGNQDATFTITTTNGSGSAYLSRPPFTSTILSAGGGWQLLQIIGGDVSSQPRNMRLTATIGGNVMATWPSATEVGAPSGFTVFTASLQAITQGQISTIPNTVTNSNTPPQPLNDPMRFWNGATTLGHVPGQDAQGQAMWMGNIVIRATISPAPTMNTLDFNRDFNPELDRNNAFNFDRRYSSRLYQRRPNEAVRLVEPDGEVPSFQPNNFLFNGVDAMDDASDVDEDLTPFADVAGSTALNLWVIDFPNANSRTLRFEPNGTTQHVRTQFTESLKYAGALISPKLDWYWASSQIKQNGVVNQDNQYNPAGDNQVGEGTISLSGSLGSTDVPAFTVTNLVHNSPNLRYGATGVGFTINGTGFDAGGASNAQQLTQAYMYQENMTGPRQGFKNYMPFTITGQTATTITGTFSVPQYANGNGWQSGRYSPTGWKLVVMIGGRDFTLANPVTINE